MAVLRIPPAVVQHDRKNRAVGLFQAGQADDQDVAAVGQGQMSPRFITGCRPRRQVVAEAERGELPAGVEGGGAAREKALT